MLHSMCLVLVLCLTCALLPFVEAWGGQGHNATARLAQSLFTPAATQFTSDLLPDKLGQIDTISSWADQVRDLSNYTWSYGLHFVNTPDFDCQYVESRDCQYRSPLHAGFIGDLGGNSINISWPYGYSNNLHSLWDSGLIARRVALDFSNSYPSWDKHLQQLLQTTYAANATQWTSCGGNSPGFTNVAEYIPCSGQWVQESAVLNCQTVYVNEAGQNMTKGQQYLLGDAYYQRNIDLVEMRIIQAGVRMAHIINTVAAAAIPSQTTSSSSSSSAGHEYSSTGEDEPQHEFSTLDTIVVIIIVLLLLGAAVFGFLYWRKRKYGLNSLFESAGEGGRVDGRRMLLDGDDSSTPYTRA